MDYRYNSFKNFTIEEIDIYDQNQLDEITSSNNIYLDIKRINRNYFVDLINSADGGWVIYGKRKKLRNRLGDLHISRNEESSSSDEENDNRIVLGFVVYTLSEVDEEIENEEFLNIDLISVSSVLSGKGYGKHLMELIFYKCKSENIKICTLQALENNEAILKNTDL